MKIQIIGFVALAMLCLVPDVHAQAVCLAEDDYGTGLMQYVQRVASGTDSLAMTSRTALQLPAVSASQVSLVTDERICKKVAAAYYADLGKPATGRSLYVVKVGTGYVANDPTEHAGEWSIATTLDRHYAVLVRFTS